MLFPPPLKPGSSIRVVAPSGPFDDEKLRSGLARLFRYRLQVPDELWGRRSGFFAGNDRERLNELQQALDCEESSAILVARGGYGIDRILAQLNADKFLDNPKWLVGFSDVTVLHTWLSKLGVASIHGPNGTTLAQASEHDANALFQLLEGKISTQFEELEVLQTGYAKGPLAGGNLTVLFTQAASGRLHLPPQSILLLEDVTETSYRIDRMLTALEQGGYFQSCAGVVLGEFCDCSAGKFEVSTSSVLKAFFAQRGIPTLAKLPVGHGAVNQALPLGANAQLFAPPQGQGRLILGESASSAL